MDKAWHEHVLLGVIFIVAVIAIVAMLPLQQQDLKGSATGSPLQIERETQLRPLLSERTPEAATINLLRAQQNARPEQIIGIARERHAMLANLIERDPATVLKVALDKEALDHMPAEVQEFLEQRVLVTGELETFVSEEMEGEELRNAQYSFRLRTSDGARLNLRIAGEETTTPGAILEVEGVQIGEDVAAYAEDITTIAQTESLPATERKVAVIMFNFQNDQRQPHTADHPLDIMFDDVRRYYEENSLNQVTLIGKHNRTGDVFGWYTIPYDNVNCPTMHNAWSVAAKALAQADVNLTGYDHIMYDFPGSDCGWAGLGQLGPSSSTLESWVVSPSFSVRVVGHEMGHNMGVAHASSYSCYRNGQRVVLSQNCTKNEYGDPFDIMGSSTYHFSNYHKSRVTYPVVLNTLTVSSPGTYIIAPTEYASADIQSLRIPHDMTQVTPNYIYIEYRRPYGFDTFSSSAPVANGVTIRYAFESKSNSRLLDMTPESTSFSDAPLLVGQIFTDPLTGWWVALAAVNGTHAVVEIGNGTVVPCLPAAPVASLSPASQWGTAGQPLTYQLTVSNRDSAACEMSTFSIVPSLPRTWSQNGASSVTLMPGESRTIPLEITSAVDAEGFYAIAETVSGFSGTATANASYNVQVADTTPPAVVITSPADGTSVGKSGITIAASASDASGITSITLAMDGNTLKSCTASPCSMKLNRKSIPAGTRTITATAVDGAGNTAIAAVTVVN